MVARALLKPSAMKTLTSLLGAALLLAPSLAHADDSAPTPVIAAPAPVYSVPSWTQPAYAPVAPSYVAPTKARSVGLLIGGIAVAGLGAASLVGGAVLLDESSQGPAPCSSGELCFPGLETGIEKSEGTFFAINGGLMMAGGVAMAIAGGWQVPVGPRTSGSLWSAPAVAVGPGKAMLNWSF